MDNTKRFILNTKKAIIDKGYKYKHVAEQMNISDRKLSDILNNRKIIDVDIILSLCDVLEVTPNDLFGYNKSA